eukprot:543122-Rhodomonas_salina.1
MFGSRIRRFLAAMPARLQEQKLLAGSRYPGIVSNSRKTEFEKCVFYETFTQPLRPHGIRAVETPRRGVFCVRVAFSHARAAPTSNHLFGLLPGLAFNANYDSDRPTSQFNFPIKIRLWSHLQNIGGERAAVLLTELSSDVLRVDAVAVNKISAGDTPPFPGTRQDFAPCSGALIGFDANWKE